MRKPFKIFVNEAAIQENDAFCIFAVNAISDAEGWKQLSPFGQFPNVAGMQSVTPADCHAMVNEFKSLSRLPSRIIGLPFYVGHPDFPQMAAKYPDTSAKGRIKDLQVREAANCACCASDQPCQDHGLFAKIKWNDHGQRIIANEEYQGHSVNWRMRRGPDGNWHPFSLKSVGFTNEPQIPVPTITSVNEIDMSALLEKFRSLFKKPTMDEASAVNEFETMYNECMSLRTKQVKNEEQTTAARTILTGANVVLTAVNEDAGLIGFVVNELMTGRTQITSITGERDTARTSLTAKEGELTTTKGLLDAANASLATAGTTLVNERKLIAEDIFEQGRMAGKFTPADKTAKVTEFVNEITTNGLPKLVEKVGKLPNRWHNKSQTGNLGMTNTQVLNRTEQVLTLVNEEMTRQKCDYNTAFAVVKKKHAGLFDAMTQPENSRKVK